MTAKTKVLVVDDDPDTLRLLSKRLREAGFLICAAGDGVTCMSTVRREDPDLIVLDLMMPEIFAQMWPPCQQQPSPS